jgi:hypothetical protein
MTIKQRRDVCGQWSKGRAGWIGVARSADASLPYTPDDGRLRTSGGIAMASWRTALGVMRVVPIGVVGSAAVLSSPPASAAKAQIVPSATQ